MKVTANLTLADALSGQSIPVRIEGRKVAGAWCDVLLRLSPAGWPVIIGGDNPLAMELAVAALEAQAEYEAERADDPFKVAA